MKKSILLSALFCFVAVGGALAGGNGWQRVNYRNSTVFTASIWIDGKPAQANDTVAAFVNGECRMITKVFIHHDSAFVSSVIHGEVVEPISFKVWDSKAKKAYECPKTLQSNPGESIQMHVIEVKSK